MGAGSFVDNVGKHFCYNSIKGEVLLQKNANKFDKSLLRKCILYFDFTFVHAWPLFMPVRIRRMVPP